MRYEIFVIDGPDEEALKGDADPEHFLVPDRYTQQDLFICDVADAVLKDVHQQLEHPFYSLSKKPEMSERRYQHNGYYLDIMPSHKGMATIYDKDILIFVTSQLMAKRNRGETISQRVTLNPHDLLMFINRGTGGKDYKALRDAMVRLRGTVIRTNIPSSNNTRTEQTFGLIDESEIRYANGIDGRMISMEVKLSDWLFQAIEANGVLTLHRDYFRLRKPIERRLYELARKHCGQQDEVEMLVDTLYRKSGSKSDLKEFRRAIRELAASNHLPDYLVSHDPVSDKVRFENRGSVVKREDQEAWRGRLKPEVLEDARMVAPGWDIYHLEQEWRTWLGQKNIVPRAPEKNFLKFCKSWFARRGRA